MNELGHLALSCHIFKYRTSKSHHFAIVATVKTWLSCTWRLVAIGKFLRANRKVRDCIGLNCKLRHFQPIQCLISYSREEIAEFKTTCNDDLLATWKRIVLQYNIHGSIKNTTVSTREFYFSRTFFICYRRDVNSRKLLPDYSLFTV